MHLILFVQAEPARTFQTGIADTNIRITSLNTCRAYWITATAIGCGSRAMSEPSFIPLHEPNDFKLSINLQNNGPCESWSIEKVDEKLIDAERILLNALGVVCGYSIDCTANSTFTCEKDDSDKTAYT